MFWITTANTNSSLIALYLFQRSNHQQFIEICVLFQHSKHQQFIEIFAYVIPPRSWEIRNVLVSKVLVLVSVFVYILLEFPIISLSRV